MELLQAVDRYPSWYPEVVKHVEVVERDEGGRATKARTALHVATGPLSRDFNLLLAVTTQPQTIKLTRQRHDASDHEQFDVTWNLAAEGAGTRIRLELEADLSVPRLLPGGIGDAMAQGFIGAAGKALSRT
jgi:ribosome-associated toxin RatA of RatAB toxin-antitoxin module